LGPLSRHPHRPIASLESAFYDPSIVGLLCPLSRRPHALLPRWNWLFYWRHAPLTILRSLVSRDLLVGVLIALLPRWNWQFYDPSIVGLLCPLSRRPHALLPRWNWQFYWRHAPLTILRSLDSCVLLVGVLIALLPRWNRHFYDPSIVGLLCPLSRRHHTLLPRWNWHFYWRHAPLAILRSLDSCVLLVGVLNPYCRIGIGISTGDMRLSRPVDRRVLVRWHFHFDAPHDPLIVGPWCPVSRRLSHPVGRLISLSSCLLWVVPHGQLPEPLSLHFPFLWLEHDPSLGARKSGRDSIQRIVGHHGRESIDERTLPVSAIYARVT